MTFVVDRLSSGGLKRGWRARRDWNITTHVGLKVGKGVEREERRDEMHPRERQITTRVINLLPVGSRAKQSAEWSRPSVHQVQTCYMHIYKCIYYVYTDHLYIYIYIDVQDKRTCLVASSGRIISMQLQQYVQVLLCTEIYILKYSCLWCRE